MRVKADRLRAEGTAAVIVRIQSDLGTSGYVETCRSLESGCMGTKATKQTIFSLNHLRITMSRTSSANVQQELRKWQSHCCKIGQVCQAVCKRCKPLWRGAFTSRGPALKHKRLLLLGICSAKSACFLKLPGIAKVPWAFHFSLTKIQQIPWIPRTLTRRHLESLVERAYKDAPFRGLRCPCFAFTYCQTQHVKATIAGMLAFQFVRVSAVSTWNWIVRYKVTLFSNAVVKCLKWQETMELGMAFKTIGWSAVVWRCSARP